MANEKIELKLQPREATGKAVKKLRADGLVPAVVQQSGKPTQSVMTTESEMKKAYANAGQRHPIELTIDGRKQLAIIKEVELMPVKNNILHVVFQDVKANVKIIAEIPLEFIEDVDVPAEKTGLIILKTLDQVEVEALPNDMPDSLKLDPSVLEEVGQKLSVTDIIVPASVTILTEPENTVAIVEEPRVQEEPEPAEEEAAEEVPSEHGAEATDNVGEEADKKSE